MVELYIFAGLVISVGLTMAAGRLLGAGVGICTFILCAVLTGVLAPRIGIELEGAACADYGHAANDC